MPTATAAYAYDGEGNRVWQQSVSGPGGAQTTTTTLYLLGHDEQTTTQPSGQQATVVATRYYPTPGIEQQSGSGIGLGLGLYICQSLVERHSGQVGVESAPGEGSTFWFAVPLLTGDAADDLERSAPR